LFTGNDYTIPFSEQCCAIAIGCLGVTGTLGQSDAGSCATLAHLLYTRSNLALSSSPVVMLTVEAALSMDFRRSAMLFRCALLNQTAEQQLQGF
jgi:hypothetical protein